MTETAWMMQAISTMHLAGLFARGKGRDIHTYEKEEQIFSSCGGAAIYRRKLF